MKISKLNSSISVFCVKSRFMSCTHIAVQDNVA